jgi:hypothetical protein
MYGWCDVSFSVVIGVVVRTGEIPGDRYLVFFFLEFAAVRVLYLGEVQ